MIASTLHFRSIRIRVLRAGLLLAWVLIPLLYADVQSLEGAEVGSGTVLEIGQRGVHDAIRGETSPTGKAAGHQKSATTTAFLLSLSDTAVSLEVETGVQPEGGLFTGPGVRNGLFIPAEAGLGIHDIYYYRPGTSPGAPDPDHIVMDVRDIPPTKPLPPARRTDDGPRAVRIGLNGENFDLQQRSGPFGLSWPGVLFPLEIFQGGGGIIASNITPAIPMGFQIVQTFSATNAGIGMHAFTREIYDLNVVTIFGTDSVDTIERLFRGEIDPGDLRWNPAFSERVRISVLPNPPPYVSPFLRNYVVEAGRAPIRLTELASVYPLDGVFTGPGISGDRFDPVVAGVGSHAITYTVGSGTPDANSTTFTVRVIPPERISLPERVVERALSAPPETLATLSGVSPIGGVFEGPGVSGGIFSPAAAGIGLHTITYTLPPDGLGTSYSTDFTILVADDALAADSAIEVATSRIETSVSDPAFDIQQAIVPVVDGGRFLGPGMVSSRLFSPAHAGLGNHRVQYVVTSPDRRPRRVTVTVAVLDRPPSVDRQPRHLTVHRKPLAAGDRGHP